MAYCKSCGAYIPDGQTVCLACGYDEMAQQRKSSGSAAGAAASARAPENDTRTNGKEKYRQVDSDFLKQQLDEQRKRQQANSRKWAETEYAQRQKAKEEQARNFTNTSGRSGSDVYRSVRSAMNHASEGKTFAILSYFPGFFLLQRLFCKDDQFAAYHAKQGRNLTIAGALAALLLGFWAIPLWIYMIYKGVSNAEKGEKKPLPYIGSLF